MHKVFSFCKMLQSGIVAHIHKIIFLRTLEELDSNIPSLSIAELKNSKDKKVNCTGRMKYSKTCQSNPE